MRMEHEVSRASASPVRTRQTEPHTLTHEFSLIEFSKLIILNTRLSHVTTVHCM